MQTQAYIEGCLQQGLNKEETKYILHKQHNIDPELTQTGMLAVPASSFLPAYSMG